MVSSTCSTLNDALRFFSKRTIFTSMGVSFLLGSQVGGGKNNPGKNEIRMKSLNASIHLVNTVIVRFNYKIVNRIMISSFYMTLFLNGT